MFGFRCHLECSGRALVALKKGSYAMLKGHPCKIMEIRVSKTGKHGHAKCSITGICALTGKKYQDVQPSHASMHLANVEKKEYQLVGLDKDANNASLLDSNNNMYDVSLEGEEAEKLVAEYNPADTDHDIMVTVMTAPVTTSGDVEKKELICAFKKVKET